MKTLGTITPDRIKVISDEEREAMLKKPLEGVEQSDPPPNVTMSIEEEQDALEEIMERNENEIKYQVSEIEKRQAQKGIIPDSIKGENAKKIGLWTIIGVGGTVLGYFMKGCV